MPSVYLGRYRGNWNIYLGTPRPTIYDPTERSRIKGRLTIKLESGISAGSYSLRASATALTLSSEP
jgi:hypothetical protein